MIRVQLLPTGLHRPRPVYVSLRSLGRAPRPRSLWQPLIVCIPVATIVLVATDGSWRAAVISTFILAIISLSQVVVTGYAGQVSLAQLAIAGAAAFMLSIFSRDMNMTFRSQDRRVGNRSVRTFRSRWWPYH